jgi:4-amino-4-deoxy-L-arabinose transferase-like glycosyltransferase
LALARSRSGIALLIAVALVPLSCGVLYSQIPPNPDQMELNYAAWRALEGERPYVDILTCNWPGAVWMHMGAIAAFGNTTYAWRIADALIMLATVVGVAWFFRQTFDSLTALIFIAFYPVLFYAGAWLTGQRDFVAMHLMLLAAVFDWKARSSANWRWQIATGICVAFAALIKPPYGLALPVLLLAPLLSRSERVDWRMFGKQAAAAIVTTGCVLLLAMMALAGEGTPLRQFWEVGIQYHTQAYARARMSLVGRLGAIVSWVVGPWWWVSALAVVSPLWFASAEKPSAENHRTASWHAYRVLVLFAVVSVISVLWQGQGLMYHGSGLYICLSLLALLSVAAFTRMLMSGPVLRRAVAGLLLAGFLFGIASRIRTFYGPPLLHLVGRMSDKDYYSRFPAGDELSVWDANVLATKIRDAQAKVPDRDQTILVWSLANVINNETGIRNATRFHTPVVLLMAKPPFPPAAEWRHQFIEDITQNRPFACVIANDAIRDANNEAVQFLKRTMSEQYRPVASPGNVTLYLRRSDDRVAAKGSR